jgi:hypothetical protein
MGNLRLNLGLGGPLALVLPQLQVHLLEVLRVVVLLLHVDLHLLDAPLPFLDCALYRVNYLHHVVYSQLLLQEDGLQLHGRLTAQWVLLRTPVLLKEGSYAVLLGYLLNEEQELDENPFDFVGRLENERVVEGRLVQQGHVDVLQRVAAIGDSMAVGLAKGRLQTLQ